MSLQQLLDLTDQYTKVLQEENFYVRKLMIKESKQGIFTFLYFKTYVIINRFNIFLISTKTKPPILFLKHVSNSIFFPIVYGTKVQGSDSANCQRKLRIDDEEIPVSAKSPFFSREGSSWKCDQSPQTTI